MTKPSGNLNEILSHVSELLRTGVSDPTHAFRLPVLATIDRKGGPTARAIILRDLDFEARSLRLHTDSRTEKIKEIEANPDVFLVFYDPVSQVQLQVAGQASLHFDDTLGDQAWASAPRSSRRAYLAHTAPGTPIAGPNSGLPADVEGQIPSEERLAAGRSQFAAIRVRFDRLEWLFLSGSGNRRARFTWREGNWQGEWLSP